MVYFQGIFLPQTHKTRSGYYLNHDNLMSVSQNVRKQLIAYFIAEQLPEKLNEADQIDYLYEKFHRITLPTSCWTFVGILSPFYLGLVSKRHLFRNPVSAPLQWLAVSAFVGALTNSVVWRCCEASMMEKSHALKKISDKYNFSVYDFAIAKKQSHVKRLLQVMDSHHETLHQE